MHAFKHHVPSWQNTAVGSDLGHQLYVLQQLLLNQYEERMNTSMDVNDQDATEKIKELRKIAFESDGEVSVRCIISLEKNLALVYW